MPKTEPTMAGPLCFQPLLGFIPSAVKLVCHNPPSFHGYCVLSSAHTLAPAMKIFHNLKLWKNRIAKEHFKYKKKHGTTFTRTKVWAQTLSEWFWISQRESIQCKLTSTLHFRKQRTHTAFFREQMHISSHVSAFSHLSSLEYFLWSVFVHCLSLLSFT